MSRIEEWAPTDPLGGRGRPKPVYDVSGSALLVGGLRKYLLWGPIVVGVGMGVFYAALLADDPTGWFVLGGIIALVGWIVSVFGIVQTIDGVWALAPLLEVAARVSAEGQSDPSKSWPAPPRPESPAPTLVPSGSQVGTGPSA